MRLVCYWVLFHLYYSIFILHISHLNYIARVNSKRSSIAIQFDSTIAVHLKSLKLFLFGCRWCHHQFVLLFVLLLFVHLSKCTRASDFNAFHFSRSAHHCVCSSEWCFFFYFFFFLFGWKFCWNATLVESFANTCQFKRLVYFSFWNRVRVFFFNSTFFYILFLALYIAFIHHSIWNTHKTVFYFARTSIEMNKHTNYWLYIVENLYLKRLMCIRIKLKATSKSVNIYYSKWKYGSDTTTTTKIYRSPK